MFFFEEILQKCYKNIAKMLQKMHSKKLENRKILLKIGIFRLSKCKKNIQKQNFCRKRTHESV